MRAACEKRSIGVAAGERDDEIGAGIALGWQTQFVRFGLDDVESSGFALAVTRAGDACPVAGFPTQRVEERLRQRAIGRVVHAHCRLWQAGVRHVTGLSHDTSGSSDSSMTIPAIKSSMRVISRTTQNRSRPS